MPSLRSSSTTDQANTSHRPVGLDGIQTIKEHTTIVGFGKRAIHVGSVADPETGAVIPTISLSTTYKQYGVWNHKVRFRKIASSVSVSHSCRALDSILARGTRTAMHSSPRLPLLRYSLAFVSGSSTTATVRKPSQAATTRSPPRRLNNRCSSHRRNSACRRCCTLAAVPRWPRSRRYPHSSSQCRQERSTQRTQACAHAHARSGEGRRESRGGCAIVSLNVARGQAMSVGMHEGDSLLIATQKANADRCLCTATDRR